MGVRKLTALEHLTAAARAAREYARGLVAQMAEAAAKDIAAVRAVAEAAKTAAQTAQAAADAAKQKAASADKLATARAINGTAFDGSKNVITAYSYNSLVSGCSSGTHYKPFLKIAKGNGAVDAHISCILADCGDYCNQITGLWFVEAGNRSNAFKCVIDCIHPHQSATTVKFGTYSDNSFFYVCLYTSGFRNGSKVTVIEQRGSVAAFDGSFLTAAPSGWTEIVVRQLAAVSETVAGAAKLTTPRAINGTNFDGTAAITTAKWGTARSLTIGSTAKSVDGSGNVAWSLAEIGAQAAAQGKLYGQTIDLTASAYNVNTYYPVTGTSIPNDSGYHLLQCIKALGAPKPSWATHGTGYAIQLSVLNVAGGWGAQTPYLIVLQNTSLWASGVVGWYSWLNNSSTPVFWLRGGGKYPLYTDYPCTWTVRTATYTVSSQSVAPTTTAGSTVGTIYGNNLVGNAATATRLATARTINGVAFDGSANINVKGFAAQSSAPGNTSLLWIDTTAKTGGLKYHNGSAWVPVPVAYT